MKKAIAMLCNNEQFEAIKPKLDKAGFKIRCLSDFSIINYLCNFAWGEKETISNFTTSDYKNFNREIHETWNERIFLEACGIETEETFEITKETIIKYKMKDEFPEVFEVRLENNTWYVCHHYSSRHLVNLNITDKLDTHNKGFGFDSHGKWTNDLTFLKTFEYGFKKATEQEVFEALKNEAVKRGYKEGVYIHRPFCDNLNDCIIDKNNFPNDTEFYYCIEEDYLEHYGFVVYSKGKWAKILETKTKEEAEKLLNCKIIS